MLVDGLRVHTLEDGLSSVLDKFKDDNLIGFDIETSGINPFTDVIATVQLYGNVSQTLALFHIRGKWFPELTEFFNTSTAIFIGHNITMFDIPFLKMADSSINHLGIKWYDTLTGETIVTPVDKNSIEKNLGATLKRRLSVEVLKEIDHTWMDTTLTEKQIFYACRDVAHLPNLYLKQQEIAEKYSSVEALRLDTAIAPIVTNMRIKGLPVNLDLLGKYVDKQGERVKQARERIALAFPDYKDVNPNSHVRLKEMLLGYGITVPNTKEATLEVLAYGLSAKNKNVLADGVLAILECRQALKRISLYGREFKDKYLTYSKEWDCYTCRGSYRSSGASTGRFTASSPNNQQIPRDMRDVFQAPKGYKVITLDYSAIEVYLAVHHSQDRELMKAIQSLDVHADTASMLFGKPVEDCGKGTVYRTIAKICLFLLLYGGGYNTLHLDIFKAGIHQSLEDTKAIYYQFYDRFKGIKRMKENAERTVQKAIRRNSRTGKQEGSHWLSIHPTGLKKMLLAGDNLTARTILNNTVQGSAGAGLKYALEYMLNTPIADYVCATVHDEIVLVCPEDKAVEVAEIAKHCMIEGMKKVTDIPVKVSLSIADAWEK